MSELSDDQVDDVESKYRAGERVKAKVLKVGSSIRGSVKFKGLVICSSISLHL